MFGAGAISGILFAAQVAAIGGGPEIVTAGSEVTLAQVADLSGLPLSLRDRAAVLVIARFPPGEGQITLSPARVAERARAQLPALKDYPPAVPQGPILVRRRILAEPRLPMTRVCAQLTRTVPAGDFLLEDDLEASECAGEVMAHALRLDPATGMVRARQALAPATVLVRPPTGALSRLRPGQTLAISTRIGPVMVSREVVVARPARAGSRVHVQGQSGGVFSAPPLQDDRQ